MRDIGTSDLKHDPEKLKPAFQKDHRQTSAESSGGGTISGKSGREKPVLSGPALN
jgi:hypothetical protein